MEDIMKIESLWRYPIKGLSPEALTSADVTAGHGFSLDRVYAVTDGSFEFDEADPQPMAKTHFLMLAKYERLALLRTHLEPETHALTVGDGSTSKVFDLRDHSDRAALAAFMTGYLGVELRGIARVAHAPGHQFTDVSVHSTALMRSISLINLATVDDLSRHVGLPLDPRRFRANVYFDGAEPWSELEWVGRELQCGDVRLRIVRRTRRCPATSVDLQSGTRDINLPLAIRDYREHNDCGIYAEVLTDGRLEPGTPVQLAA
jgi:uncharacterized protein YcbX